MLKRGRTVGGYSELFVRLDTSKLKISVAVAEGDRSGEVRFFGDISAEPASVAALRGHLIADRPKSFAKSVIQCSAANA
jgi:hypothetical protein